MMQSPMKSERRLSLSFSDLGCDLTIVSSTTSTNRSTPNEQQSINNITTTATTATTTTKRVHFAKVLCDVITYHDGPADAEMDFVYDRRSEAQVLHEARQEHQHLVVVAAAGQLAAGYTSYAQALETLYRKKGNNRRCTIMMDKNKETATFNAAATSHQELHRMLLPRHFEWALRSIYQSEWRGLEHLTAAGLIAAHRRHVVEQVLGAQSHDASALAHLAQVATAQTQHAVFVAMLLGKGGYERVVLANNDNGDSGASTTTPKSSLPRPIRSPAA